MADEIRYMDSFKRRLDTKGYPIKGFYYQYGMRPIEATDESVAENQKQTASVIKTAYSSPTATGVCLTIDYMEDDKPTTYECIHIWYKDMLKPKASSIIDTYSLAAAMTIPETFKPDVYNMVYLDFDYKCDLMFDNPSDIDHVLGSAMDKRKYSEADMDGCFISLPSARWVLRESMVAGKKRDVFQISTSGLIRI